MKCFNCDEQVPDTAAVCGYCGQVLNKELHAKLQESIPLDRKRMPPWLKWAIGVGAVLIIAVICLVAISVTNNMRRKSVKQGIQTEAALAHDTNNVPKPSPTVDLPPEATNTVEITSQQESETPTTEVVQTEEAGEPKAGDEMTNSIDGAVMVYVPEGNFKMGAADNDQQAEENEKPQRTVYLDAFWIHKLEITNKQYLDCMERGDCLGNFKEYTDDYYPVVSINWHEASAYCELVGGRLPTEAEWEKAARGVAMNFYPWGDTAPNCALVNYSGCVGTTAPVGSYPNGASPYGAMDMAGNVWEWVADWYDPDYYSQSGNTNNPLTSGYTGQKVIRGGSWGLGGNELRVSFRGSFYPEDLYYNIGFRCVLPEQP